MLGPVRSISGYLAILLIITLTGCTLLPTSDLSLQDTKTAISVQQTQLSRQILTATAEQSIIPPPKVPGQPSPNPTEGVATQAASTPGSDIPGSVQERMKSAKILLYEDMIIFRDTNRYVKDTLETMDLPYVDVGNAMGDLKSQLMSNGPDGNGWDLVIIAAEAKPEIQGEFFTYLSNVLDKGASVILETWYLDKVAGGTASALLARCGVAFEQDWRNVAPNGMVMFALDPSNPVLQEPNSGLSFTKVTSYWWDPFSSVEYDIGDLMKITGSGDAKLLIGTSPKDTTIHGTSVVCVDGHLILQTFSSHQLTYNSMRPLWENYIYNTLKARFSGES
jgi:hypothetical protein